MRRAVAINLAALCLFFLLHIVFAANDMRWAFAIVASLISLQTIGFGPITAVLSGASETARKRTVARRCLPISLVLSFALAWAYAGMTWSVVAIVGVVSLMLTTHVAFERRWRC